MSARRQPSVALVTASDAAYFHLLAGWLASTSVIEYPGGWRILVVDTGLSDEQRCMLRRRNVQLVEPAFELDLPSGTPAAMTPILMRPLLPEIAPGYDYIMWCDADCWFQSPHGITEYVAAAGCSTMACCAEADCAYDVITWKGVDFTPASVKLYRQDRIHGWFARHYTDDIAYHLSRYPLLNTGVLCAASDSAIWRAWHDELQCRLQARQDDYFSSPHEQADFMVELLALNAVVRLQRAPVSFLPPRLNWLCHLEAPAVDEDGLLRIPIHPFTPLDIIHASGGTKRFALRMPIVSSERLSGGFVERTPLAPGTILHQHGGLGE